MKYRKKPMVVEATQWFKNGDHPNDYLKINSGLFRQYSPQQRKADGWEGDLVRYYRSPDLNGQRPCNHCGIVMHDHGWIETLEEGHIVCPGDFIITGLAGENYPCKPEVFARTYEEVK